MMPEINLKETLQQRVNKGPASINTDLSIGLVMISCCFFSSLPLRSNWLQGLCRAPWSCVPPDRSGSGFSLVYNSYFLSSQNMSVLENHHWRSTIGMLRESRLLAHLPKEMT